MPCNTLSIAQATWCQHLAFILVVIWGAYCVMVSITTITTYSASFEDMKPWVVKEVQQVDGKTFVQLSKDQPGFCRLITNQTKGLRDYVWLDNLKQLRNDHAFGTGSQNTLFQTTQPQWKTRKLRHRKQAEGSTESCFNL